MFSSSSNSLNSTTTPFSKLKNEEKANKTATQLS